MPKQWIDQAYLVFNIEPAGDDTVTEMNAHEIERVAEASNIDPARTALNRVLLGSPEGPKKALNDFFKGGPKRASRRARSPYLRIVLGASPSFFRPQAPERIGTWDEGRLEAWLKVAMAALRQEFGADLVHVSLHLDEDTPHLHVLVAPTYVRKPRAVDRRRKNETDAAFAARKAKVAAHPGVRTVGRASHPTLRLAGSFEALRQAFGRAFSVFGIHPGNPRTEDDPKPKTTRQWVNEEAARLKVRQAELDIAWAEIGKIREAAVLEARMKERERADREIARIRDELLKRVTALEGMINAVVRPLKALRDDAAAEAGLVRRIRQALKGVPDKHIKAVRRSLQRVENQDYQAGRLGQMQRDQDATILQPFRQAEVASVQEDPATVTSMSPESTGDIVEHVLRDDLDKA